MESTFNAHPLGEDWHFRGEIYGVIGNMLRAN